MPSLNSAHAPGTNQILEIAKQIFRAKGEDKVYEYLHDVASNDFKCPDRCDAWAQSFYQDHSDEIEGVE